MEPMHIKQLAEKLQLSIATVSRAFREQGDISPKTRERVLEMARQWNYRPTL